MGAPKKIRCSIEKWGNMHAIPVAATVAAAFLKTGTRRVICTINDKHSLHAALMTRKEQGDYYIYMGKAVLKKTGLTIGATVTVQLAPDNSEYQFDMPEELAEVLNTDSDAHAIFHALTPGRQRGLIHLVAMLKTVDKRIERALKIADKIKAGITTPAAVLKH
jgi:antitoxin component of MazEF toxin-antitoxin module